MKRNSWITKIAVIALISMMSFVSVRTATPRQQWTIPETALLHLALPAEHLIQALSGQDKSLYYENVSMVESVSLQEAVRQLEKLAAPNFRENQEVRLIAPGEQTLSRYRIMYVLGVSYTSEQGISEMKINKGRKHGIAQGMAVVSSDGLVGQVVTVSDYVAKVMLLDDLYSNIYVQTHETSTPCGDVVGDPFNKTLVLKQAPPDAEPAVGDTLVTMGQNAIPEGLEVGRVVSWHTNRLNEREAMIAPSFQNLHRSTFFVVTEVNLGTVHHEER